MGVAVAGAAAKRDATVSRTAGHGGRPTPPVSPIRLGAARFLHARSGLAGTEPAGFVHPLAIEAMAELGINISGHRSNSVDTYRGLEWDLVVTVCDDAAENCPLWLGEGEVVHISFPDPAAAVGSEEEQMLVFRIVRDDIKQQVLEVLRTFKDGGRHNWNHGRK